MHFCHSGTPCGTFRHFWAQIAEKVVENEILLCKRHIPSNFYLMKKIDLVFEILSLFNEKSKKMHKNAKKCHKEWPNRKMAFYKKCLEFFSASDWLYRKSKFAVTQPSTFIT